MARASAAGLSAEPSHAVLQEAAEWYAVLRSGGASAQEQSRWRAWLERCAEHRAAWRHVEDISRGFVALQETPDPLQASDSLFQATVRMRRRRRVLAGLGAVAGAGLLAGSVWRPAWLGARVLAWAADYRTGIGEQREIVLADGSRIWLNTDSAFDADYGPALRRIALVAGEMLVETAHAVSRPFVVDTAQGRMRALGTRFNVRLDDAQTLLAVYAGAVEITPAAGDAVVIRAGQQAEFTRSRVSGPAPADAAHQSWTRGVLVAQDIPLREVVRELRRYRVGHVGLAQEVADLKVYGSFPVRETDRTLAMLATVLPVRIERTLPWWVSIEPRG